MKTPSIAIVLISAALPSTAAILKGKFVRNELTGEPVSGVAVKAKGASPTMSLNRGDFTLDFPAKNPGDLVTLEAEKAGLVVVNWVQLKVRLPSNQAQGELIILLAEERNREEMARRFFDLKGTEASLASYRRNLQEAGADKLRLQTQLEQARAVSSQTAKELARLKPGQTSELYEEAMRLVAEGKIVEALDSLPTARLKQLVLDAHERKRQAEREIEQATEAWLLRANLLVTQFQFADAEQAYQAAVENTPESFDAVFDYAHFSASLNHNQLATTQYERCLVLARAKTDPALVALTLNNLGILYEGQQRIDDARQAFEEALTIYRLLVRANPEVYRPMVAMTLNNLGILYRDHNRMDDAGKAFDEALSTYQQLARADSGTYLPNVARTLINIGVLRRAQDRMEDAGQAYDDALATYRRLARGKPDTYQPSLALTLNNLGVLRQAQNRPVDARKAFDESLSIRRQLAVANPDTYQPDVAQTLNNLGALNSQDRMDDALKAFEEALSIRRRLSIDDPVTYQSSIAGTLNNLGRLYGVQNRMGDARKAFEEALSIRRQLAHTNPDSQPDLAQALLAMGILEAAENHTDVARKNWEEALDVLKPFATRFPGRYDGLLSLIKQQLEDLPH